MAMNYTELLILIWTLYGVSACVTAGRAATRFSRQKMFQIEDYIIFFAIICLTALSVVITLMTPKFVATADVLKEAQTNPAVMMSPKAAAALAGNQTGLKFMFSQMFLFFTTLYAAKFSLLFFFRRLIKGLPRYMWMWYTTLVIMVLLYLASMASNLLTCTPLDKYWSATGCSSPSDRSKADKSIRFATGADIAGDIIIMILPLNLIRQLQLARRQRAGLAAIFMVGFIIIAFAIIRLLEVTQATRDTTQDITKVAEAPIKLSAWSHIEASVSIIVASLPTFQFLHVRHGSRKSSQRSPGYQRREFGPSFHTIGSGGGRIKRSRGDDTDLGTLVMDDDDAYGSSKELSNLRPVEAYDGITRKVEYEVKEQVVNPYQSRTRVKSGGGHVDITDYRRQLHPNHSPTSRGMAIHHAI